MCAVYPCTRTGHRAADSYGYTHTHPICVYHTPTHASHTHPHSIQSKWRPRPKIITNETRLFTHIQREREKERKKERERENERERERESKGSRSGRI